MGDTGTGKTSAIKKYQNMTLSKDQWETSQMVFSATSTALQVQDYIQSKVDKHRKGVYGPKVPGKKLFLFLDDLNMPAKEKYGA
jgi:dynein heavy chain